MRFNGMTAEQIARESKAQVSTVRGWHYFAKVAGAARPRLLQVRFDPKILYHVALLCIRIRERIT